MTRRIRLPRNGNGNGIEKQDAEGHWQLDLAPSREDVDRLAIFRERGEVGDEDFQRRLTTSISLPF
jgi:hypothetical protein